ncbi:hypothetical protein OIO90_004281 [Microbotryomycetes sp. JL221]|nr:hypothetical protein OIO90_004281 [Microbotryomycetes sp. JL221]
MSSTSTPTTMHALTARFLRQAAVKEIRVPTPTTGQVLVKVEAVGLNAIDSKAQLGKLGNQVVGCDFAGTIIQLGAESTQDQVGRQWQVGDRVAGMLYTCSSSTNGAFAEYAVSNVDTIFKIPDGVSFEAAAGLPLSFITSVLSVEGMLLQWASENNVDEQSPILIYSASTGLGQASVQLIRMLSSTRPIITLSSPSSFELLKSYGATLTLSYKSDDATLLKQIEEAGFSNTGSNPIKLALDCFSEGDSSKRCQVLMANDKGRIVRTLPPPLMGKPKKGFVVDWVFCFTALNQSVRLLVFSWPPNPKDQSLAAKRLKQLTQALEQGKFKPMPIKSLPGGLDGINAGLDDIMKGKVQGNKFVLKL